MCIYMDGIKKASLYRAVQAHKYNGNYQNMKQTTTNILTILKQTI